MDDKSFNNPNGSNQSGEQSFGAPPRPEINLRTMKADIDSVQSGEIAPIPRSVLPPENDQEPVFKPETQIGPGTLSEDPLAPPKSGKHKFFLILLIVLVLIGGGFSSWYFLLRNPASDAITPVTPPSLQTPPPAPAPHTSLFIVPPQQISELRLANLSPANIATNLQILSAGKLPDGSVQEFVVLDDQGGQTPFGSYLNIFAPSLPAGSIASWFEDDFTAFLFYNKNGVWPGYVAKIKNGVNVDDVKNNIKALENSAINDFYLSASGSFSVFKDGQISGKATRYAVGSATGASFNYGFLNGYLVISTSYDGLKAASGLLGF